MPWNDQRVRDFRRAQQAATHFANHPQLRRALEAIEDDPDELERAKRNPKAYLQGRGFDLPDEATVDLESGSCCYRVCFWGFCFSACTTWWN
jgi:hypothetical protein